MYKVIHLGAKVEDRFHPAGIPEISVFAILGIFVFGRCCIVMLTAYWFLASSVRPLQGVWITSQGPVWGEKKPVKSQFEGY